MPQVGTELKNALGTGTVRETRRADQKQGLPLGWTAALQRRAEFLEFHPALLLGRRFQAIDVTIGAVRVSCGAGRRFQISAGTMAAASTSNSIVRACSSRALPPVVLHRGVWGVRVRANPTGLDQRQLRDLNEIAVHEGPTHG